MLSIPNPNISFILAQSHLHSARLAYRSMIEQDTSKLNHLQEASSGLERRFNQEFSTSFGGVSVTWKRPMTGELESSQELSIHACSALMHLKTLSHLLHCPMAVEVWSKSNLNHHITADDDICFVVERWLNSGGDNVGIFVIGSYGVRRKTDVSGLLTKPHSRQGQ